MKQYRHSVMLQLGHIRAIFIVLSLLDRPEVPHKLFVA